MTTALQLAASAALQRQMAKRGVMSLYRYSKPYMKYAKRARMYGPTAVRAGARIYRWYKRQSKRRHKAHRRSAPPTRRVGRAQERYFIDNLLSHATLNIRPIQLCNMENELADRTNITMYLKGLQLCDTLYNNTENNLLRTVEVHWALCQLKCPMETFVESDRAAQSVAISDYIQDVFFRDYAKTTAGPGLAARATPFVTKPLSYPYDYLCAPINTDRMNVITHKRFTLVTRNTNTIANRSWKKKIDKYFPIKKRIAFTNERDVFGKTPFFVCTWYVEPAAEDYDSTVAGFIKHSFKDKVVFT